jgi:hypothetical protein
LKVKKESFLLLKHIYPISEIMPRLLKLGLTESDWQQFQRMGDLNRDGKIDDADAKILIGAFNSKPGDANWNQLADLDADGWVGPNDILIMGNNYELDIWKWKGLTAPAPTGVAALVGLGLILLLMLA